MEPDVLMHRPLGCWGKSSSYAELLGKTMENPCFLSVIGNSIHINSWKKQLLVVRCPWHSFSESSVFLGGRIIFHRFPLLSDPGTDYDYALAGVCSAQESYLCSFSRQTDLYSIGQLSQGQLRRGLRGECEPCRGFLCMYTCVYVLCIYIYM